MADTAAPEPEPEPSWYWVTHHLPGTNDPSVRFMLKTVPEAFWDEMTTAYQDRLYLIIPGRPTQAGVPARSIRYSTLTPCAPHEIPRET
jgi:hypothetical protein